MLKIKTEKLYYGDSYIKEFTAEIADCVNINDGYGIILDKTAFYPEGGGQPSDVGEINGAVVIDVKEENGIIVHVTKKPLEKRAEANCKIDWLHRFSLMQEHTGEHIVSGVIKRLFGYNNVGFHMGSESLTIDIDGIITKDEINAVEQEANKAVYLNIPVESKFISPEALADITFRSKREFNEDVRIVTIDGFDCCACCGTHVSRTGEVGIIKITDFHKHKKGMRIYMQCGMRALKDYSRKNEIIHEVSVLLSAENYEAANAVKRLYDENAALKYRLTEYKQERIRAIADSVSDGGGFVCIFERGLSPEELRKLCSAIIEKTMGAAAFSESGDGYKYAIGSKRIDVRRITARLNERFSGKGGGNANLTGGTVFGNEIEIRSFFSDAEIENE